MQCTCGGSFVYRSGFAKRGGKPYAFWGCDGFRRGCHNTLTPAEYNALEAAGVSQTTKSLDKAARTFAKMDHRPYTPKQRRNENQAAIIDYRHMTDEQEAIIARLQRGNVLMRTNAGAGSGKSSTARQAAARIKPLPGEMTTGILLSFGKKAADEQILPFNWVSSTVHSAGNDAVAAYFGVNKRNPNEYKTKNILRDEYGVADQPERVALYSAAESIVDMAKALALPANVSDDILYHYAELYNTNVGDTPAETFTYARAVLKVGNTKAGIVKYGHDYADMCYLPVILRLPVAKYRYVGIDEYQDSSPARLQLAQMMFIDTLFVIGDEFQNIMGFTFAHQDAMGAFLDEYPDCEIFPITMNFRCPEDVIGLAKLIDPSLRARPNAPKGGVHEISDEQFYRIVQPGDLVLCRVNADLIHAAYELIKQGIGAVVLGRDIGIKLKNIIKQLGQAADGSYLQTIKFLARLNEWYESEGELIAAKNVKNPDKLYQTLDDNYQCILALCGVEVIDGALGTIGITTVQGVLDKIDEMFGEETDSQFDKERVVILATIHKMKGGQCRRVFDLRANENHPHPMAITEYDLHGEKCVLHVCITRAGDGTESEGQALFFVGGMPAMLKELGGREWLSEYTGVMR